MKLYDIYFLVGIPASGKSTYAVKLKEEIENEHARQVHVLSSDAIRAELYGDESVQKDPQRVFKLLYARADNFLAAGHSIIIDSTGVQAKHRKEVCRAYNKYTKCAIIIPAFIEDCVERDQLRSRHCGEEVILHFARQFEPPIFSEGWDAINLSCNETPHHLIRRQAEIWDKMVGFNQENHHHRFDLFQHCAVVSAKVRLETFAPGVAQAAELHDIGKLYTQTFKDGEAHYYNHHNVGAYLSYLFPSSDKYCALLRAALIAHHMDFYFMQDMEQLRAKLQKIYPENDYPEFFRYLKLIHEADEYAR